MRRAARGLVTAPVVVVLSAALGAAPAYAARPSSGAVLATPGTHTLTLPLAAANWFSRGQVSNVGGLGVQPPAPAPDPTVPEGDLAVAGPTSSTPDLNNPSATTTAPAKESYVAFDLSAVPAAIHVTKVVLSVPLDSAASQGTLPGQNPVVVACAVRGAWSDGEGDESFSGRPGTRCGAHPSIRKLAHGGTTYEFDVTSIAAHWFGATGLNNGVALTDDPSNTNTAYQVVFGPRSRISVGLTYVVPAAPTPAPTVPPTGPAPGQVTGDGTTTGSSGGSAPPPGLSGGSVPPPTPAPQQSPVVPPPPVTAAATPAAATTSPGAGFWIVAALLALLLVIVGVVLHNPAPAAAAAERRGVGRALLRNVLASPSTTPRSTP